MYGKNGIQLTSEAIINIPANSTLQLVNDTLIPLTTCDDGIKDVELAVIKVSR